MTPETSGVRGAHESVDLRHVAGGIPALLVCALPDGSVEFVNQSWREYTDRSLHELARWGWPSVVCPEDLPEFIVQWDAARADGKSFEKETRVRRFDGGHRRFLIRMASVLDETNQIIRWFGTGHDIEDLKIAQDQLRLAVNTAPALVHSARPDGYVDFLNKGWLDFLGLSMEEASGWRWTNAFHPDDVESCIGKWRAALASGEPFEAEGRVRRADGEYRTLLHRKLPLRDEQGNIVKWYGSSIDIEDRKQAEDALRRSESLLAQAQRLTRVGCWVIRPPDVPEYWSPVCFEIFGINSEQGPPRNLSEYMSYVHPDDRERILRQTHEILEAGQVYDYDYRIVRPNGEIRMVREVGTPVYENTVLKRFVGAFMDITEQEQKTEALRQSELYLAEGQRLAHMGSWAFNPSGLFNHWSRELFQIYGRNPDKGAPTLDEYLALVHPQERESMAQTIRRMLAEGSGCDLKKRIVRPDGQLRHIRCVGVPVVKDGILTSIVGTAIDITEQEQLTQELRRREAYLAEAQKLSHTGSFGWHVPTGEISWSEETFRIFEYDPAEKPSLELVLHRVHPEDVGVVHDAISQASRDGNDFDLEHRLLTPGGTIKHVHVVARAARDESGKLVEFHGAVMDVTARHLSQQSLERALEETHALKEQFQLAIDTIPGLVWSALPDGHIDFLNQRWREYTGLTLNEASGWGWQEAIHPEDINGLVNFWNSALASGKPGETEARLRRFDGAYRWFIFRGVPLYDGTGTLVKWYGQTTDIDERKCAEEKVRLQEVELRQILNFTPQHVAVLGPDQSRLYTNQAALKYFGLTLEAWRNCDPRKLIHPDDRERMMSESPSKFLGESPDEYEGRILRNDGKYRWFLFRPNPLRDEQGRVTRWYIAATDIEDRKQAEERLEHENVALREEVDKASMFEEIVGTSAVLQAILSRLTKVAPTDSTVLITGETGTGKELIARAIHRRSQRSSRAFVSVNCAAIPRDLIASELFGHEKGAFTGAMQRRIGRFELAGGGTIFLDEIGELPAETQIALLRVLQEHEFERVGGNRSIQTDVRVIAATNRDLQAAIAAATFRSDLFYRLNVFPIEIPALRERTEDIPMLVEYFIDRYARKAGKSIRGVNKKTMDLLRSYPWPGNIRELQNVVERSVILCESETFSVDESWLPRQSLASEPKSQLELSKTLTAQEKEMIEHALRESRGQVFGPSGAAAKLGMPRSTLESKIRSLKIDKNRFRTSDRTA